MAVLTITQLKALWIDGFIPDQADYVDLFDTIEALGLADAILAINGLTRDGNNVKLGGSLSENTILNPLNNYVHIGDVSTEEGATQLLHGLTLLANAIDYALKNSQNTAVKLINTGLSLESGASGGGNIFLERLANDGKVILTAGAGIDFITNYLGRNQGYRFRANFNGAFVELNFRGIDADRNVQFPNKSGTVAFLDDVKNEAVQSNSTQTSIPLNDTDYLGKFDVYTPSGGTNGNFTILDDATLPNWTIGGKAKILFRGTGALTFTPFNGSVTILQPSGQAFGENDVATIVKVAANTWSITKGA